MCWVNKAWEGFNTQEVEYVGSFPAQPGVKLVDMTVLRIVNKQ